MPLHSESNGSDARLSQADGGLLTGYSDSGSEAEFRVRGTCQPTSPQVCCATGSSNACWICASWRWRLPVLVPALLIVGASR